MDPQAGKCLHWSNRLLSEGRGLGIVCLLASQRPQKVHNDTLTSCETLIAMRVIHAADRGAVEDWIKGCGDKERGKEVLNSLAGMARGEAFVWSPEIDFGPKRVKFPMFTTFDSFAPPQLQKKVNEKGWADVDLAAVRKKLSAVIERAKAEDPKELQRQIAELNRELTQARKEQPKQPATEIKRIDVPVVGQRAIKGIQNADASMRKTLKKLREAQEAIQTGLTGYQQSIEKLLIEFRKVQNAQTPQKYIPAPAKPVPIQQVAKTVSTSGNGDIPSFGTGELKVLTAIAQHQEGVTREQITVLTGYKRSSRDTYLHRLRAAETIELRGDRIFVTQIGIDVLGHNFSPLPTGEELRDYWQRRLPGGEKKLFEVIINAYPDAVDRQQLDEATGYKRSSRDTFLHRLRNRQLIEVHGTAVRASERLF
jgi:hypothetical protein